jgi:hypothetical protein
MHKQKHKAIELYDLRNDLAESINLASEHPEIVQKAEEIFEDAHHPSEHYVWEYLKE